MSHSHLLVTDKIIDVPEGTLLCRDPVLALSYLFKGTWVRCTIDFHIRKELYTDGPVIEAFDIYRVAQENVSNPNQVEMVVFE